MAYVRMVTKGNSTILRNMDMTGKSIREVQRVATAMDSLISEEGKILRIEVDYEGCMELL